MGSDLPHELLAQLVQACEFAAERARRLAAVNPIDPALRHMLLGRSVQYRRAASEIGSMVKGDATMPPHRRRLMAAYAQASAADDDSVISCWERAECFTLMCFRDAFDARLPPPLAAIVKQHFEAGVAGLKAIRALQATETR